MIRKKQQSISGNDLGFGNNPTVNNQRMINPDGSSNVRRKGLPFFRSSDMYNYLITMSWSKFCVLILISYLIINTVFALIYMSAGLEHLIGIEGHTDPDKFLD